MLESLANHASRTLGDKPMELVWAMKDLAFGSPAVIARWQRDFPSANVTRVPEANHYIQEDAPEAIAAAVERVDPPTEAGRATATSAVSRRARSR